MASPYVYSVSYRDPEAEGEVSALFTAQKRLDAFCMERDVQRTAYVVSRYREGSTALPVLGYLTSTGRSVFDPDKPPYPPR